MCAEIYGIDTDQKITALMVRDAIVECFYQAHCADAGIGTDDEPTNRIYCQNMVKKGFDETGGNFNDPNKKEILEVLKYLVEFSKNFRDPDVIKKHKAQIMTLVDKLEN